MSDQSKRDAAVALITDVLALPRGDWLAMGRGAASRVAPHIADALAAKGLLVSGEPAAESFGVRLAREGIERSQAEAADVVVETAARAYHEDRQKRGMCSDAWHTWKADIPEVRAVLAAMPKPAVSREQVEQAALFMFAVRTYSHRRPDYARKCWDQVIDDDDREAWRRTARDLLAFADIPVQDGEHHGG